jgi:hypothetical protein
MERREFLHRSLFATFVGGMLPLLQGCGSGGNSGNSSVQYQPVTQDFPTLSFDNQNSVLKLFDDAINRGSVSIDLQIIVKKVTDALTPDQIPYIDSLHLADGTPAQAQAAADAYFTSLTKVGADGLLVFTGADLFTNDADRFMQLFSTLEFGGGLPVLSSDLTVTIDDQGNVTTRPAESSSAQSQSLASGGPSASSRNSSPGGTKSSETPETLHAYQLAALCPIPPVRCVTLYIQYWITVVIYQYVRISIRAWVYQYAVWDRHYEWMLVWLSIWYIVVIYQTRLVTIAQTICNQPGAACAEHPQGAIGS